MGQVVRGLKNFRKGLTRQLLSRERHGELPGEAASQYYSSGSSDLAHTSDQPEHQRQHAIPIVPVDLSRDPRTYNLRDDIHRQEDETLATVDPFPLSDRIPSPVPAELRPSVDYAKMGSPILSFQEISLTAYISRLREFFKDVYNLPWIAPRPTVDYFPGQSGTRPPPEPLSPPNWYALLHRKPIDLMSNGSSSSRSPPGDPQPYLPDLGYEYEASMGASEGPTYAASQSYPPVYPQGYYMPQPLYVQTGYLPSSMVQIYGPPMPRHMAGQYPYPIPWPLPPSISQRY
jgi:hypothetical protein